MAKKIKLGARVEYRDSQGYAKLGLVTGTQDTVSASSNVPGLGKDEAHLIVHSPSGNTYTRQNVRQGDGPQTFSLL